MSYYYKNEKDCAERRIDSDLSYACDAMRGSDGGFQLSEVAYVLAEIMGENDGPNWHWLIAMKDHTYAYVSGGCDYTGWGCQDWGEAKLFPTLAQALIAIPEEPREILAKQLNGRSPFAAEDKKD